MCMHVGVACLPVVDPGYLLCPWHGLLWLLLRIPSPAHRRVQPTAPTNHPRRHTERYVIPLATGDVFIIIVSFYKT